MGAIKQPTANSAELILQRLGQDHHSTTGVLISNVDYLSVARGEVLCYTLEDRHRDVKVRGRTRIPAGLYPLGQVKRSGILGKMRKWFPEMGFIVSIEQVPNFRLLRIHTGVRHQHTDGCPLVSSGAAGSWRLSPDEASLTDSRNCYRALHERVFVPLFETVDGPPHLLVRDEGFLLT